MWIYIAKENVGTALLMETGVCIGLRRKHKAKADHKKVFPLPGEAKTTAFPS